MLCYAFGNAVYERKISDLIELLLVRNFHHDMLKYGALASLSLMLLLLRWTFEDSWSFGAHAHWNEYLGFEVHPQFSLVALEVFLHGVT